MQIAPLQRASLVAARVARCWRVAKNYRKIEPSVACLAMLVNDPFFFDDQCRWVIGTVVAVKRD
jgi:hypothetical protein